MLGDIQTRDHGRIRRSIYPTYTHPMNNPPDDAAATMVQSWTGTERRLVNGKTITRLGDMRFDAVDDAYSWLKDPTIPFEIGCSAIVFE